MIRWISRKISRFGRSIRRGYVSLIQRPMIGLLKGITRWTPKRSFRRMGSSTTKVIRQIENTGSKRPGRRWINMMFAVPAIAVVAVTAVITANALSAKRDLGRRYLNQGLKSANAQNYHSAQIYLTRALEVGGVDSREVEFGLAVVWQKLGYSGRSMQIFQRLAPVNRAGYAKAHRHLAILISAQNTGRVPENDVLARWLWHLTHAVQGSEELQESWGNYYVAVNDLPSAIRAYSEAAKKYPRLFLSISSLFERLGKIELRTEALRKSERTFRQKLSENPNDRNARVIFATTLLQLGELAEAEQVLRTGLRLDPEGPFRMLLAATFVKLFDALIEKGGKYQAEALQQLKHAFEFDPNFSPALKRLLKFAQVEQAAIPEMRKLLKQVLVTGRGTALAHLALSNLAWLESKNDLAVFHIEQAMALDAKMPVVANNLAWLLAHDEPPDFERSLRIAEAVTQDNPNNPRFLDTKGTVLIRMGRKREGLVDLEKALPGMPNRSEVHKKIAGVYRELGMDEIARNHEIMAGK